MKVLAWFFVIILRLMSLVGDLVVKIKVSSSIHLDIPEAFTVSVSSTFSLKITSKLQLILKVAMCPSMNILVLVQNYYKLQLTA